MHIKWWNQFKYFIVVLLLRYSILVLFIHAFSTTCAKALTKMNVRWFDDLAGNGRRFPRFEDYDQLLLLLMVPI